MVEVRAKGGFGCVATGELPLNFEEGRGAFMDRAIDVRHFYGSDFDTAKEYADRIHAGGALAYMEISHEGLEADDAAEPWGPCDFVREEDGRHVFGMDRQMMEKVCRDFFVVGRFATACGFDGVLLHGGHGFLLQQFVSPLFNHRTDEFGGSIENRSRFPKMILRALRAGMGEDKVLELRMSAEDGEEGGMTLEDSCGFAEQIDGLVDIFHVSNGIKKLGNRGDTFSDIFDVHATGFGHTLDLDGRIFGTDVRVQSGGGGGRRVGGDLLHVHAFAFGDGVAALFDGLEIFLIGMSLVGTAGRRRVVSVAGCGRTGLEILVDGFAVGIGEGLSDQGRSDDLTFGVRDHRAVGLLGESQSADAGHQRRVYDHGERADQHGLQSGPVAA